MKAAGLAVEMVFVSSDRDQDAFNEYHASMPFLALPYSNRDLKATLSSKYGVSGIPTLVFIDGKTGELITTSGRGAVTSDTFIEDFPYHPKPIYDLASSTDGIQSNPSVIILCESTSDSDKTTIDTYLTQIAVANQEIMKKTIRAPAGQRGGCVAKYFTGKGGGPTSQIRKMCGLPGIIAKHEHALVSNLKATEDNLGLRVYPGSGSWNCDGCGESAASTVNRFRCTEKCDYDLCASCNTKLETGSSDSEKMAVMVILDIGGGGKFYSPSEGNATVTKSNVELFLKEFNDGALGEGEGFKN